jgi:predicted Zn-dependent protease
MRKAFAVAVAVVVAMYAGAAAADKAAVDKLVAEGIQLARDKQLAQAERRLKQALGEDPKHLVATTTLGAVLVERERWADAISVLRHALALDDRVAHTHYLFAVALWRTADGEAARNEHKRAIALDPTDSRPFHLLGPLHALQGQAREAEALWLRAHELAPTQGKIVVSLGDMYLVGNRHDDALKLLTCAELHDERAQCWYLVGRAREAKAQRAEAIAAYEKALAEQSFHTNARKALDALRK